MKAGRILASLMAAAVMSVCGAVGASAEEYVTVTFDPNGVEAFEPIKVKIRKGTTLTDSVNGFDSDKVLYDSEGKSYCVGDKLFSGYYSYDTEGEQLCYFKKDVFNKDTVLYADWDTIINELRAVYDPDLAGKEVMELKYYLSKVCEPDKYMLSSDTEVYLKGTSEPLDEHDVLEEGKTYSVYLMLLPQKGIRFDTISNMNMFINGRDVTELKSFSNAIRFYMTPEKWQLGNVDLKEPEKGVTAKDVMTLIQLANGNKKYNTDGQYVAADMNKDTAVNYKDVMLAIREYKKPGSVIK